MSARSPLMKAKTMGSDLKNPSRYGGRNCPSRSPIGDPPEALKDDEREAWHSFVAELPWLAASHRAILHLASILRAKVEGGIDGVNHLQVYSSTLSKLGATPADESRIGWHEDDEDDDEFFGKGAN